eukprot:gene35371-32595_t
MSIPPTHAPCRATAPPPQSRDWAQQTSAIVSDAKTQKGLSRRQLPPEPTVPHAAQRLRDESTATRKATDRQTREQQTHVDDMLRKKVAETQSLKRKIEGRLHPTIAPWWECGRNKAAGLNDGLRKPRRKAENRSHLRDKRPARERPGLRIEDRVHRALKGGAPPSAAVATTDLARSLLVAVAMTSCKQALKGDHADKARSLKLDMECLDLPAKSAACQQREDSLEPNTPRWRVQSTERNIAESAKLEHESCELRRKIMNVMKQVDELQQHNQSQVREALAEKCKKTQLLQTKLNAQLLEINSELDELAEQTGAARTAP